MPKKVQTNDVLDQFKISKHLSIRDAIKHMDEAATQFCVCIDDKQKVLGVLTDGDFRRAVHNGVQLDENVVKIINKDYIAVAKDYTQEQVESIFRDTIIEKIPVINKGRLIAVLSVENFYDDANGRSKRKLNAPVVIMAGGKGARLDPFTRILPKPLVPIGNDPVIKVIMDEFNKFGMEHFHITLQDKARMVRAYFHDHELGYHIHFTYETHPLGTAGALKYLENKIKETFFVSNCDIIIRADYGAFYDFHQEGGYALSMVGSLRQYIIPYGVCDIDKKGALISINEKPKFDFLVSTGMYLLEPSLFKLIPQDAHFDMTDLIREVQAKKMKIGIFPVSEKSWIDVGQLSEYKEIVNKLSF